MSCVLTAPAPASSLRVQGGLVECRKEARPQALDELCPR